MFSGRFVIRDCIEVTYKQVPINRLIFTFSHLGVTRPKYELVIKMVGDVHASLTAINCTSLGEAEMTAAMMLCNVATQLSLVIKYRLYNRFCDDKDNFVWGSQTEIENVAHALFYEASRCIPAELRIPFPKRVHERLHRVWLSDSQAKTSEDSLGLIRQPKPICPLVEDAVWDQGKKEDIIALIHQLRDWGQSWKNLAKILLPKQPN